MVDFHFCMYSLIFHIPFDSIVSSTGGYHHYLSSARQYVIPAILRADLWWNHSKKFNIDTVTTQISLPYNITI